MSIEILDDKMVVKYKKFFGNEKSEEIKFENIDSIGIRTILYNPSVIFSGHDIAKNILVLFLKNGQKKEFNQLTEIEYDNLRQAIINKKPDILIKKLPMHTGVSIVGFPVANSVLIIFLSIIIIIVLFGILSLSK